MKGAFLQDLVELRNSVPKHIIAGTAVPEAGDAQAGGGAEGVSTTATEATQKIEQPEDLWSIDDEGVEKDDWEGPEEEFLYYFVMSVLSTYVPQIKNPKDREKVEEVNKIIPTHF